MKVLQCREVHDYGPNLLGTFATAAHYDHLLVGEDAMVLKPDGSPLLVVLRHAVSGGLYQQVYAGLAPLARSTSEQDNRGVAAGVIQRFDPDAPEFRGNLASGQVSKHTRTRYHAVLLNGRGSKTTRGKRVASYVAGYVDRAARFPYCRQTAYTAQHTAPFAQAIPALGHLSHLLAQYLPARYAAQAAMCQRTQPAFVIPGTVFTTLTVNRNWQTAFHRDAGDLPTGFGVMLCLRSGHYTGGYYVMPEYRVAVDLHAGDVLLSDVHCIHGNTALEGDAERYERITIVCYYRKNMIECGTPEEELQRAKRLREGALV